MSATDEELLRRYTIDRSQEAFAELVRRYLNLVYSVALRHVRVPHLAEDVAQSVFIKLSVGAGRIKPGVPLVAWLHLTTRYTALNAMKLESRRQVRETAAGELSALANGPVAWARIEPLLDEAIEALPATDRTAVLLRYFHDKSLGEVGSALGTSEAAAQKRVSRAVEQLRLFCAARGVTVGAAALSSGLAANAVQAAPAALAASISSLSLLAASGMAPLASGVAFTMSMLQKSLVVAALAAAIGTGVYQMRLADRQSSRIAELELQTRTLERRQAAARQERNAPGALPVPPEADPAASPVAPPDGLASAVAALSAKVRRLRDSFASAPEKRIPEMALLTEDDWMKATSSLRVETPEDLRASEAAIRTAAKIKVVTLVNAAVARDRAERGPNAPLDLARLAALFEPPIDPVILARYTVDPAEFPRGTSNGIVLSERLATVVDPAYDTIVQATGSRGYSYNPARNYVDPFLVALAEFRRATGTVMPSSPGQLEPFFEQPPSPDQLQREFEKLRQSARGGADPTAVTPGRGGRGESQTDGTR